MDSGLAQRQRKNGTSAAEEMAKEKPGQGKQDDLPETGKAPGKPEPREPRTAAEIEHDFRMASFDAHFASTTTKFSDGCREMRIDLRVEGGDERKVSRDILDFSASEQVTIRMLPKQPRLNDKEPQEFGSKIPPFGVEMIERLEKLAFAGRTGWEKMGPGECLNRIGVNAGEMLKALTPREFQRRCVDIANLAFFIWHNSRVAQEKAKR